MAVAKVMSVKVFEHEGVVYVTKTERYENLVIGELAYSSAKCLETDRYMEVYNRYDKIRRDGWFGFRDPEKFPEVGEAYKEVLAAKDKYLEDRVPLESLIKAATTNVEKASRALEDAVYWLQREEERLKSLVLEVQDALPTLGELKRGLAESAIQIANDFLRAKNSDVFALNGIHSMIMNTFGGDHMSGEAPVLPSTWITGSLANIVRYQKTVDSAKYELEAAKKDLDFVATLKLDQ